MENQFSLTGLALLTPEIKELINLSESADFRTVKKMRTDEMRAQVAQYQKKIIQWEAAGLMLPGAWEAVAPKLETILAAYESEPNADNETALQDAQASDCKTVQDAYHAWLYTARPTPAQALVGAAKMRAEMRAAGIIEAGPGPAPVGAPVAASSPGRPAPAATPTPAAAAVPPAPVASASAAQPAPAPTLDQIPAAGQYPRLADALTLQLTFVELQNWLAEVGLIWPATGTTTNPKPYTAKQAVKPYEWAAVREALYNAGALTQLTGREAAAQFSEAFKAKVSPGTMDNRANEKANKKGEFYKSYVRYSTLLQTFLDTLKADKKRS